MSRSDPANLLKLNRRQSLQLGAATTAAGLLAIQQAATPVQAKDGGGTKVPPAPFWPPFVDELPDGTPEPARAALVPPFTVPPNVNASRSEERRVGKECRL